MKLYSRSGVGDLRCHALLCPEDKRVEEGAGHPVTRAPPTTVDQTSKLMGLDVVQDYTLIPLPVQVEQVRKSFGLTFVEEDEEKGEVEEGGEVANVLRKRPS